MPRVAEWLGWCIRARLSHAVGGSKASGVSSETFSVVRVGLEEGPGGSSSGGALEPGWVWWVAPSPRCGKGVAAFHRQVQGAALLLVGRCRQVVVSRRLEFGFLLGGEGQVAVGWTVTGYGGRAASPRGRGSVVAFRKQVQEAAQLFTGRYRRVERAGHWVPGGFALGEVTPVQ